MPTESNHPIAAKPRINPVAQYLITLAAVIGAYSGYLKFAVPAIEGPAIQVVERSNYTQRDQLPSPLEEKSHLIPFLPPDAWELEACTTLLIDAGTILYTSHEQLEDGSLLIKPFTLISGLQHDASGSPTNSQPPTVLRCLSGAKLKFNKPIGEILSGKAKMESAQLNGRVVIYRPPTKPDQSDAVRFVTSNVQIDKHRVYTLESVEFEFGSSRGSGRNMLIDLAHEDESTALIGFSNINGIRRLELAFLDKLRIESSPQTIDGNAESKNEIDANGREPSVSKRLFSDSKSPLEITCKGPFVFDFKSKTASFRKQVVVEQVDAFNDNIRCDELTLVFDDKSKKTLVSDPNAIKPDEPRKSESGKIDADLQLERFIARGSPAVVVSRSQSAKISGEYLSYNTLTNQIDGSCRANSQAMVTVVSPEYQMVAKQLRYQIADDGSLGEINATGPGRLLRIGNSGQDDFYSAWKNSLTTHKIPQQPGLLQVVVDGSAEIRIADQTSIFADRLEIIVWQFPKQSTDPNETTKRSWEYRPSKLFTTGDVTIVSPQLDGQANHLTATWPAPQYQPTRSAEQATYRSGYRGTMQLQWNESATQSGSNDSQQLAIIPRRFVNRQIQTGSTKRNEFPVNTDSAKPSGFVEQPTQAQQTFARNPNARTVGVDQDTPKRKLKFKGETVDVRLVEIADSTEIRDLTVVGNITIVSTPIVTAGQYPMAIDKQRPLTITGHRLQLTPQSGEGNYRTLISGKNGGLATVSANDFNLDGQNINLDQIANKVWVEGSGSLALKTVANRKPSATNLTSQTNDAIQRISTLENLNVAWNGGMIFDGSKIYFENNVEMSADQTSEDGKKSTIQSLSEGLSVELSKPVQFQNLQTDSKVVDAEIRELIFVDKVPKAKRVFKVVEISTQPEQAIAHPVVIQNRTHKTTGEVLEQQKISVPNAVINLKTNSIESRGPGSIAIHRRGKPSSDSSSDPFGRLANQAKTQNESGISFIQINFDGEMHVDMKTREMQLNRNIRTVYSPAQNWNEFFNPDDVLQRAPGRVFMTCEKLLLAQWVPRAREKATSEMIATGNAHIFSDTFEATANRVSYDRADDTLVVVGTPRNDANLLFKQSPNDRNPTHLVAHKITYRVKDQATGTFGLESLNVNRN